jgi:proteasome alpha subunit
MQGPDQQAYDRGTTIFSPDGRLYQVEYAREAVKKGAPAVGVRAADALVLAARVDRRSPLVEARSVEKLYTVDDHVGVASAGHAADTRRLVDVVRRSAQAERVRYGEPATTRSLATSVADHIQERTQTGGARPYGTALLVGGYDEGEGPRLFEIDPSGSTEEWRADAVGRGAADAVDGFEERYDSSMTTEDALTLALDGLDAAADDLDPGDVDAATVGADGYVPVPDDRLRAAFDPDPDR